MPRKSDSIPIKDEKLDRRVKLTTEQKIEVKLLYDDGNHSQRTLAVKFGVSRRTIQFIIDPSKKEKNLEARKNRGGWKQYYNKDKHAETMKEHRNYKKELHKKGLIKNENSGQTETGTDDVS